mgnify:CR=1 FL=1
MTTEITATYRLDAQTLEASPECRELLAVWEGMRAERLAPPWRGFDWRGVPSAVIPFCGVVDVIAGPPLDFVYRFWGTAHVRAHDQELTGHSVMAMRPEAEANSVFAQYRETLEAARPLFYVNTIEIGKYGSPYVEYSLRLPFSDDGERIDKIFAFSDLRQNYEALVRDLTGERGRD